MTAVSSILIAMTFAAQADQYEHAERAERAGRGDDIQLVCYGEAEKTVMENRSGMEWDNDKHQYVQKSTVETGKSRFDTAVNVSIQGSAAQIRLPKQLIPPIHGDSNDGWWDLMDLIVGHDEIRGRFRLNALNRPAVVINRRSGVITVDGMIKFSGRCDADNGHRRF
ncbi:hypothetical protein BZG29_19350 [Janthinobacterium sp. LM6]|uniref:hypothetical protein n=1 Tax=Janthinobacterium sp. LM6 TaxID=1938606 RepID=UPI000983AE8E|nr:hypothetical protein [Janthinobacterium sp. LM6]AQR70233.1 hypothetical protein BZG29_19350 [Janthinobacterium sp. LM6]